MYELGWMFFVFQFQTMYTSKTNFQLILLCCCRCRCRYWCWLILVWINNNDILGREDISIPKKFDEQQWNEEKREDNLLNENCSFQLSFKFQTQNHSIQFISFWKRFVMNFDEKMLILMKMILNNLNTDWRKGSEREKCEVFTFTFIDSWFLLFVNLLFSIFTYFSFRHFWVSDVLCGVLCGVVLCCVVRIQLTTKKLLQLISSFM
jgi:hypothetical protein